MRYRRQSVLNWHYPRGNAAVMSSQSVEYTQYTPLSLEWNMKLHIYSWAGPGWIYLLTHLRANGTPTEESYHIWANLGADQYCTVRHCIIAITHSMESWTGSHSQAWKGLKVTMLIAWYSTITHAHWWNTFRRNINLKISHMPKEWFVRTMFLLFSTGCL